MQPANAVGKRRRRGDWNASSFPSARKIPFPKCWPIFLIFPLSLSLARLQRSLSVQRFSYISDIFSYDHYSEAREYFAWSYRCVSECVYELRFSMSFHNFRKTERVLFLHILIPEKKRILKLCAHPKEGQKDSSFRVVRSTCADKESKRRLKLDSWSMTSGNTRRFSSHREKTQSARYFFRGENFGCEIAWIASPRKCLTRVNFGG